jgi:AraC-like DNA-binding protein
VERDWARFLRPAREDGIEALHANFVHHRYPPHAHDVLTVASVLTGAATFDLEGRRYVAPAGTLFVVPPDAAHTGEAAAAGGYSYRVLYFDPVKLSKSYGCDRELKPIWSRSRIVVEHDELASTLHCAHAALAAGSALELDEAMAAILDALDEVFAGSSPKQEPVRPLHPAVLRARDYLDAHWSSNVSLQDLASNSGVGGYRLVRMFTSQVGMAPSFYGRSLKIRAARRLLRTGEPIAEVAAACGFYDQAHLTRHFKKIVGVTPGRYATELRSSASQLDELVQALSANGVYSPA